MAKSVKIETPPYTAIDFPPVCCYCLEPATASRPIKVWRQKLRTSRHMRVKSPYPIPLPYCAEHAYEARIFQRYDALSTTILFIVGIIGLVIFDLTVGQTLRATGAIIWWCAIVLVILLLTVICVALYLIGRRALQRNYPSLANHFYSGSLGVEADTLIARQQSDSAGLLLAITFTFTNHSFADQVAALHATEARPAPDDQSF